MGHLATNHSSAEMPQLNLTMFFSRPGEIPAAEPSHQMKHGTTVVATSKNVLLEIVGSPMTRDTNKTKE